MAHKLSMGDDGILRVALIGDIGTESIDAFLEDITPFLEAATEEEPLLVLAESGSTGKYSSAARKRFAELLREPRVKKVALVNARRYVRVLISFILRAAGRDNIHCFDSEEEALAWLKEGD
jgi:hypothetical protein